MSRTDAAPLLDAALAFLQKLGKCPSSIRHAQEAFSQLHPSILQLQEVLWASGAQREGASLMFRAKPSSRRRSWTRTSKTCPHSLGTGVSLESNCFLLLSFSPNTSSVQAHHPNGLLPWPRKTPRVLKASSSSSFPEVQVVKRLLESLIPQGKVDEECFVLVLGASLRLCHVARAECSFLWINVAYQVHSAPSLRPFGARRSSGWP